MQKPVDVNQMQKKKMPSTDSGDKIQSDSEDESSEESAEEEKTTPLRRRRRKRQPVD